MHPKLSAIISLVIIFSVALTAIIVYKVKEAGMIDVTEGEDIALEQRVLSMEDAPKLIFPLRNAVISEEFETFPVILQPVVENSAVIVYYNEGKIEVTLADEAQEINVPVSNGLNKISIVYENRPGEYAALATPTISMLSSAEVKSMLAALNMEAEGMSLLQLGYFFDISWSDFFHFEDEPPYIFLTPVVLACATDVDVHRPLSQDNSQTLIAEAIDFSHGAYTLRNDDGDWTVGPSANIRNDALPVSTLDTDIDRTNNANENDLVKVKAHNPFGHQRIYLFAFPIEVEADRNLGTKVEAANGDHASPSQLAYWQDASKSNPARRLPRMVPKGTTEFWLEGLLGGRYRLVTGFLPPGTNPNQVKYDIQTGLTRPVLGCMRQATVTVPVIDIYQDGYQNRPNRMTAFDVMWGGRPYFEAELWPPGGQYEWGARYKLGTTEHDIPGTPSDGTYASMQQDNVENEPAAGATEAGHTNIRMRGNAGNGNKAGIEGGFQVHNDGNDRTPGDSIPQAEGDARNRYPDRVSLAYEVENERLVRPEHLQVIIPQLSARPAAQTVMGNTRGVASQVQYTIQDAFGRTILAGRVDEYLDFYGAGLKAWEALGVPSASPPPPCMPIPLLRAGVRPPPDLTEGPARNDLLTLNNVHPNNNPIIFRSNRRPGTAQRSQARVLANRMTAGTFTDTLRFVSRPNRNQRYLDWQHWSGNNNAAGIQAARNAARQRMQAYRAAGQNAALLAPLIAADTANTTAHQVLNICQDVILQIRVGDTRHDLDVLETNSIIIYSPFYFENFNPTPARMAPFHFHLQFTPGTITSRLVGINHLRVPP